MKKQSLLSVFFTAILIGGLVLASAMRFGTVRASTDVSGIPKPSVPEFTVELVDSSYDVPTTYSIDPYTGENVTHAGHHVENKSIEVRIKNQPFTPYLVQEGTSNWTAYFHYNVRVKGHFEENWITLYSTGGDPFPTQSNSDNTVMTFQLAYVSSESGYSLGSSTHSSILSGLPSNAQIDFQVEAMIGGVHRGYNPDATDPLQMFPWVFTGEKSGWSSTQTITIGESQTPTSSPANSPMPNQEPTLTPEQIDTIIGAAIIVAVISAGLGLLIYLIKRK